MSYRVFSSNQLGTLDRFLLIVAFNKMSKDRRMEVYVVGLQKNLYTKLTYVYPPKAKRDLFHWRSMLSLAQDSARGMIANFQTQHVEQNKGDFSSLVQVQFSKADISTLLILRFKERMSVLTAIQVETKNKDLKAMLKRISGSDIKEE